ncbi:MAG: hypothetical protein ACD_26C00145G0005 [uncultured bacterium]|nr:MAG: hypothetical protein ACD_26C00145G0005 [uncultured bacterium]
MKLDKENINKYANFYDKRKRNTLDKKIEKELRDWFKKNRYLNKKKFIKLGRWKSERQIKNYKRNSNLIIEEITKLSFKTENEEIRIKILMVLHGVSYPVASVILHFAFPDKYPILDFRVVESLGWKQPEYYSFNFWQKYCKRLRNISKKLKLPLRIIDKALWEYSKQK